MEKYFKDLSGKLKMAYDVASLARSKGLDPKDNVEIVIAKNLAERVEGLISTIAEQIKGSGVVERISELEKKYGAQDWRVALDIALEVAQEKFCKFKDRREAMEVGIRVGLAYVTVGVVASPLEGFVRLNLKHRRDGKGEYFDLMFSGPIRSAGGTAMSFSVMIADYIRNKMGYKKYDPSKEEIKRMVTEAYDYHERVTNLQYLPSEEEIEFLVKNLPVQVNGDPSEKREVSNYKNLDRIETDRIRNGPCLVVCEGIAQKTPKLVKQLNIWGKDFDMNKDWVFLEKFINLQKKIKAKGKGKEESEEKITPDFTFIKDVVAGRPVLTHPMAKGGFRLRYGRSRVSGFSAQALHPATMIVLDGYVAMGTQLKVERPGKAAVQLACDQIEGPIVRLNNGDVLFLEDVESAKKVVDDIEEIIYLGDVLINYGDFLNRAHKLIPVGYNEEWWMLESGSEKRNVSVDEAIQLCKEKKVPLHPRYTFHWTEISKKQFFDLIEWLNKGSIKEDKVVLPIEQDVSEMLEHDDPKRILEILGVPHRVVAKEYVVIEGEWCKALLFSLGGDVSRVNDHGQDDVLGLVNWLSGVKIRDKSGTFVGARMGRPEKAKQRKLTGSPQVLFPVGNEGGRMRDFRSALAKGFVRSDFPLMKCLKCQKETIYRKCEDCGNKTLQLYSNLRTGEVYEKNQTGAVRFKNWKLDIHHFFDKALGILNTRDFPELIKGVRGTSNESHMPENLVKGILRAKHNLYVNKDGTVRYDMTEMPITHFKAKEIGTSVEKLRELGYNKDIDGKQLEDEDQILELKPQDVILPSSEESLEESADDVLFRIGNFLDELLVKFYGLESFYNFEKSDDLVGHLILGMSPHTSAGIVGRIIGFSEIQGLLAHPYLHSIMRRDCDGDEACVILLMDALLNFSIEFLPAHRGGKQDEPLVLTSTLIPAEVDDMVFDMDVASKYPIELYEAAEEYKYPWEVKISKVGDFLGTKKQFEGFMFTHDTDNINDGVKCSAYKKLPTMQEKVQGQMRLAEKIRAVNEIDVAKLVIERHFIRDIKGNLRKFSMQQFRCVNCNEKFRRPPLSGKCLKCNGRIIFTIAHGSIIKYLEPSLSLARKYDLPPYLKQTLELTKRRIESYFGKDEDKQEGLAKWFG